ncbi:MAG: hypothetical protein Q8K65_02465 [Alphaproteobacteria bacterium]|nr:hypothetical protein [Alphaproteobacteria bacterium]
MSAENNDTADKVKRGWEYRSSKFVLRIVAFLFFASYLFAAAPMAWMWGWSSYYKSQPVSRLDGLIEAYAGSSDQSKLLVWIQNRPEHEREQIKEKLLPHAGELDSVLFLFLAEWAVQERDAEQVVFWNFYARYRLHYDALRCGAPNSVMNMKGFISLISEDYIDKIVARNPHLLPKTIQKVLDMDALYPANNDPSGICKIIYKLERTEFKPAHRERWPSIRHTLRAVTEYRLKKIQDGEDGETPEHSTPPQNDEDKANE